MAGLNAQNPAWAWKAPATSNSVLDQKLVGSTSLGDHNLSGPSNNDSNGAYGLPLSGHGRTNILQEALSGQALRLP